MRDQEGLLRDMEDGHIAGAIQGVFGEFLQDQARLAVTRLIAAYRNGNTDHDKLVGYAAELACLDNIVNELQSRQARGIAAREKELGNAQTVSPKK